MIKRNHERARDVIIEETKKKTAGIYIIKIREKKRKRGA